MVGILSAKIDCFAGPEDAGTDRKRTIPLNSSDDKCIAQIRFWADECSGHDACPQPRPVPLPKRIIEVPSDPTLSPRLCISNGAEGNYLFLSNCSGDVEFTKLTSSNIASFQEGIDPKSLRKTFAEAIDLTRRLGYQYLWIRDLCILQDDKTY